MDRKLKSLYNHIKDGKINSQDAAKHFLALENQLKDKKNPDPVVKQDLLQEKVENYLKKMLSSALRLPVNKIEADTPLEKYGIDSIMVLQLTNQLEKIFGSLSKTLFFEYQNIQDLTRFFIESQPDKLVKLLGINEQTIEPEAGISGQNTIKSARNPTKQSDDYKDSLIASDLAVKAFKSRRFQRLTPVLEEDRNVKKKQRDIAIVGVSGRYPGAKNLREFWKNLKEGKDCIIEIPPKRWDHNLYFDEDKNKPGKTYSKWGGFLDDVACFDPFFFNISSREAAFIDPQERLFLECVYAAIEDAGYTRAALGKRKSFGSDGGVGVYVGVMYEEYQLYGAQEQALGRPLVLSGSPASIANRVSYFCNFHGPSMAIDTMCSSSLTAIHLACKDLRSGECEAAIAGGVNVSIHPNKYLALGAGKFVSSKGRCESFGQGGDGYVPGEGVGAVLLKPLSKAVVDGDHIYGIIKGTALNHGGKTNGYTVPNPFAQAGVIGRAFQEAGINPRMISYIEAHGTGTSLGDPIEISGLSKTFQAYTSDKKFCAIGSAKSNIGHCESAAGIAGVTKVLLQLKYRQLAPSLHSETLNPNIDFAQTPFVVQQTLEDWKRPIMEVEGEVKEFPRIAGVSSFGAGGSNAHLVIEEYIPLQEALTVQTSENNPPNSVIIVLSAKDKERLNEQVQRLLAVIKEDELDNPVLPDLAYTLQVGREAMEERLALIVDSLTELEEKLRQFIAGQSDGIKDFFYGQAKKNKEALAVFTADLELQEAIEKWIQRKKYAKLLNLWVMGLVFDWNKLYGNTKPKRISLPTYPFAREHYWLSDIEDNKRQPGGYSGTTLAVDRILHPLVQENTSDFSEQRYSSTFTGQEPFELMTFEEIWREENLTEPTVTPGTEPEKGASNQLVEKKAKEKILVCFLSAPEHQKVMSTSFTTTSEQVRVIYISQIGAVEKRASSSEASHGYSIAPHDRAQYEAVFKKITKKYGKIAALFYLWPLEDPGCIRDYACIVNILQACELAKVKIERLLLAASFTNHLERCFVESWLGFERSLGLIWPNTELAALFFDRQNASSEASFAAWLEKIRAELRQSKLQSVLYQAEKRCVCKIRPTAIQSAPSLIKARGTYLITGGCGGLGGVFAEYLARKHPVNLVLTGRSPLDPEKKAKLAALEDMGSQVSYLRADICDQDEMKAGLSRVKARFGEINGVIHAAGITDSRSIFTKDLLTFEKVLEPKIKGTQVLSKVLSEDSIDFICYFSSSAAILGDFGFCDYAIGNRFQMAYAHYYNQNTYDNPKQHKKHNPRRRGKAVVINWPLWKDGGMGFNDAENTRMYLESSGQRLLEAQEGVKIFEQLLGQPQTQHLVLAGKPSRVNRFLGLTFERQKTTPTAPPLKPALFSKVSSLKGKKRRLELRGLSLKKCLEWDLKEQISQLLKISRDKLDPKTNLIDFGFDSVSLAELAKLLTLYYGLEITPALFFSHATIAKLSKYYLTEHREAIEEYYREDVFTAAAEEEEESKPVAAPGSIPSSATGSVVSSLPGSLTRRNSKDGSLRSRFKKPRFSAKDKAAAVSDPIAIIGMSGRFPGARNIEEMWAVLVQGKDEIREIPRERFAWELYYGDPGKEAGKTNGKWCGCIPGVSEFDPLFFEISPREAEYMDPRQRLLLQEAWRALEDAGYGPAQIKNNRIGMFVGAEEGDYQLLVKDKGRITSNHSGILAARLAYFLNLSGPVLSINTTCSSGLVAAHQAVLSLKSGECDTALAAGVNLMLTPGGLVGMGQAGMLSSDGRCYAFDKRANGMVPGEAVAVVVLKPLAKAKADGDPIYAVIRGSGINYDGKTNGITAPSGAAQTRLLKTIYDQNQIDPDEIEYIVVHGTGTRLGDPVEVNALVEVFKESTTKESYCALTSAKTNFGHSFAASGLVSLIGLVQAMRNKTIPATLHCREENDYINWQESPFYINKKNKPWHSKEGKSLTGAVSAFGMSGTNAHLVVSSYTEDEADTISDSKPAPYHLLTLSAQNPEVLREKIQDLLVVLERAEKRNYSLAQFSYTLSEGRRHFNHRCAAVVQDWDDATYIFKQMGGKEKPANLFQGKIPRDFTGQKAIERYAADLLKQSRSLYEQKDGYREILSALADLYCQGYEISFKELYGMTKPRRVNLPPYPFAREHYWVAAEDQSPEGITNQTKVAGLKQRNSPEDVQAGEATVQFKKEIISEDGEVLSPDFNAEYVYSVLWEEQPKVTAQVTDSSRTVLLVSSQEGNLEQTILEYHTQNKVTEHLVRIQLSQDTKQVAPNHWLCDVNDPFGFETCLAGAETIERVFYISAQTETKEPVDSAKVLQSTQGNEVQLIRLIKALKSKITDHKRVDCFILTQDNYRLTDQQINPYGGGITGLAYALAQGEFSFQIRNVDVSAEDLLTLEKCRALLDRIITEKPTKRGDLIKLHAGSRYKQVFCKIARDSLQKTKGIQRGGVYVILGGSGNVGGVITRHLMREYQARVVWIGRKAATSAMVKEKLESLRHMGEPPFYIQADVTDFERLKQAVSQIKKQYPKINGAIFSGLVFNFEETVAKTKEKEFREIFDLKAMGSLNFYSAFSADDLDFMCYFSSAQAFSFSGAANLAAYAAGITFADTLVKSIQKKAVFPVGVINWGFWSSSVAESFTSNVSFIKDQEGFACFENFTGLLQSRILDQVICLKASEPVRELLPCKEEEIITIGELAPPSGIKALLYEKSDPNQNIRDQDFKLEPADKKKKEQLEDWLAKLLFVQIRAAGLLTSNYRQEMAKLREKNGVDGKHERWLAECLHILENKGYIHLEADRFKILESEQLQDRIKVWQAWEPIKAIYLKDPNWEALVRLLDTCLQKTPEILRGKVAATDIMFPDSSTKLVESIYQGNAQADYLNTILAGTVEAYISRRIAADPQTKIRLIEIGAGTGGTSTMIFPKIQQYAARLEYCYTDISKYFLTFAQKQYESSNPYLTFQQFDVETPLAPQEIAAGVYDLAIAANVLHATKDIRKALRNVKATLKTNGLLFINECTKKNIFLTLTFGLLDGWWLYEDHTLRIPGSPLLAHKAWEKVLKQEGFKQIAFPAADLRELGQQVIIAESDGCIRQKLSQLRRSDSTLGNSGQKDLSRQAPRRMIEPMPRQTTRFVPGEVYQEWLTQLIAKELRMDVSKLDSETSFQTYGMDSILLAQLIKKMERELKGVAIEPSIFLEYSTVKSLAAFLTDSHPTAEKSLLPALSPPRGSKAPKKMPVGQAELAMVPDSTILVEKNSQPASRGLASKEKIAVIGMGCHFPDAPNIGAFWSNLRAGKDSVHEVPSSRWSWERYFSPQEHKLGKSVSKWGGFIKGIKEFDPGYFGITESLAPHIDPLQRQVLEVSVEALADAGYAKNDLWGKQVGVFLGARSGSFGAKVGWSEKDLLVCVAQNFIAVHLSHCCNFKGPNMVIDTACSSSLTALHTAIRSIQNKDSEMALAGGVDILLDEGVFLSLSAPKILSPEGRCKTFDATANGIGLGEGCGILVLKPLPKALADNNKIYGIIEGTAINCDGNTMGVTTPDLDAQSELIEKAIQDAAIRPESVSYVETHGTGTLIGDPIELKALTRVFADHTKKKNFCGVGSVKSNLGHLLSAAGVASIIKVLLALTHQELPPTLHCKKPNPRFNFQDSPLYIVQRLKKWAIEDKILRAGVSAFGLGGHNAHIIVSNEGIPVAQQASLEPRGPKVVFNKKRYWPHNGFRPVYKGNIPSDDIQKLQKSLEVGSPVGLARKEEEAFLKSFKTKRIKEGAI